MVCCPTASRTLPISMIDGQYLAHGGPPLTVIMDGPAVQRLAFHDRGQMVSLPRGD